MHSLCRFTPQNWQPETTFQRVVTIAFPPPHHLRFTDLWTRSGTDHYNQKRRDREGNVSLPTFVFVAARCIRGLWCHNLFCLADSNFGVSHGSVSHVKTACTQRTAVSRIMSVWTFSDVTNFRARRNFPSQWYIIASGASFLVCSIARAVYIIIYIIVRTSFRKCTPFLNSEYNFQFYRRVIINLQQYRVRRNPRAQRCSVF